MPVTLPPSVARALSDARLTSDEVRDLKKAVQRGELTTADLQRLGVRYADLFGAGAGAALVAIAPRGGEVAVAPPLRSLGDTRASAEVLSGAATLSKGSKHPAVLTYQRALGALASRMGRPEWALADGADGVFGKGTIAAVIAFQTAQGLPATGTIDQATALKMEELLIANPAPQTGGVVAKSSLPSGERIAQAARDLVASRGADYGTGPSWKSPNPRVPGNSRPGESSLGALGRWKCNLFGLDSLYAGGAETPHYPGGFYPIAIEIPNYARGPNAPLIKLGEVWTGRVTPEERDARIQSLMKMARPGDLIIVNHQGDDKADGGHTRVVVANDFATNGTVDCAQAGGDTAHIRAESLGSFSGEEAVYLLRPAQTR